MFGNNFAKPDLHRAESKSAGSPLRRFRLFCGAIVEAPHVQIAVIFLIIINALLMGLATFDFVTNDPSVDDSFQFVDRIFLTIFTVELGLQLIYRGVFLFVDGWLVFDFVIVVMSWSLESMQIIRSFRIFRAFRLVTRIGPLRELVLALGNVMPRLNAIFVLLALVFYVYGVLFTQLFRDLELSDRYFNTLPLSLFTCMQLMTLEWADIAREVMEIESWAWAPFLSFIQITGFIVFNLIVAVVCDAVSIVDKQVKAEQDVEDQAERERRGLPEELTVEEMLVEQLFIAQQRILVLTDQVHDMKARHGAMAEALSEFASEWEQQQQHDQEDR
jgi:hypothetical protein